MVKLKEAEIIREVAHTGVGKYDFARTLKGKYLQRVHVEWDYPFVGDGLGMRAVLTTKWSDTALTLGDEGVFRQKTRTTEGAAYVFDMDFDIDVFNKKITDDFFVQMYNTTGQSATILVVAYYTDKEMDAEVLL